MRFITHYEEYPIYEPAEGGYYYSGNRVIDYERNSKNQCKKMIEEIWESCKQDNLANYGAEEPDFNKDKYGNRIHPWIRINANMIIRGGRYIGDGESYVIERHKGSQKRGWRPYC